MEMVRLEKVSKMYGEGEAVVAAVREVDLRVDKGEMVLIAGRSGAGKTTLLSLVGGLTAPTAGRVFVDGVELGGLDDGELSSLRSGKIGFIFQFASLIPTADALENVMLPVVFGGELGSARSRARELLERVGLEDRIASYPFQLSGGEQRRVAIARALVNDPDIILADEPTGDLDEETESEVVRFFAEINGEGKTLLVVSHNNLAFEPHADSVYRMAKGGLEMMQSAHTGGVRR